MVRDDDERVGSLDRGIVICYWFGGVLAWIIRGEKVIEDSMDMDWNYIEKLFDRLNLELHFQIYSGFEIYSLTDLKIV